MSKKIFLLFSLLALFLQPLLRAQENYNFHHLTVNEGLSQNTVNRVLKDRMGYIWVATTDGLNRYDGYEFTTYQYAYGDSTSLSNNRIEDICLSPNGELWIGSRAGLNRYDRINDSFKRYAIPGPWEERIAYNFIRSLFCDEQGVLWIGTMGGGLHRLSPDENEIRPIVPVSTGPPENQKADQDVSDIIQDQQGHIWIATNAKGINRYNPSLNIYEYFAFPEAGEMAETETAKTLYADSRGMIWVATQGNGLYRLDPFSGTFEHFHSGDRPATIKRDIVKDVIEYNGRLWIATDGGGIQLYRPESGEFDDLEMIPDDPLSLNSNAIYSFYRDNQDILWIGTFNGGINQYDPGLRKFEHHISRPGMQNTLSHPAVLCFEEHADGRIWIGTDGGGLNLYDPENDSYLIHDLDRQAVTEVFRDRQGRIWVGTWSGGMYLYDEDQGILRHYLNLPGDEQGLINNNVWAIHQDFRGQFWIGTSGGLARFDPESGNFTRIPNAMKAKVRFQERITSIYEDQNGKLWFCGEALYELSPRGDSLVFSSLGAGIRERLGSSDVRSIYQDHNGQYWICTEGSGLVNFRPEEGESRIYSMKDGLPNNSAHRVLEDAQGFLWISTNRGLCSFYPATDKFTNYDLSDGLQSNQFSYAAALQASDGKFYFGGVNGFNAFYPDSIKLNPFIPPVVFTGLQIFNQPVVPGQRNSPLDHHISETEEITLKYNQAVITFEFAALNYSGTERNQYSIMMEGFENDWRNIGNERSATFTNLDAGHYTFRVRASNNDQVWNEEGISLSVRVRPPWWGAWYAYLFYGGLILAFLFWYRSIFLREERLRHDLNLRELEKQQIEELNRMELRFFTNISHEFKTPLTLIQGPLENMLSGESLGKKVDQQLELMLVNVRRLLRLINQLMDFRKVKQSTLELELRQGDIIDYLSRLKRSFDNLAVQRDIRYHFHTNAEQEIMWFDPDKIEKIVYNLLSNAFKFTPEGGSIELSVEVDHDGGHCRVSVQDSGVGIPEDKLSHIFERFYQVDQQGKWHSTSDRGTGIGLSLTKTLVEQHQGKMEARSQVNAGSLFVFTLPLERTDYKKADARFSRDRNKFTVSMLPEDDLILGPQLHSEPAKRTEVPANTLDASRILLVEDNREVLDFLLETLESEFMVYGAENGVQALEAVKNRPPDLVVTDIMMPVMDGLELCRKLKEGEESSHIPVILLTAKGSQEDRIAGLKEGADDYIPKPFHPEELLQRIRNILAARRRAWEKFGKQLSIEPSEITVTSSDERFLSTSLKIVEEHIDDPEFDVSAMVSEVGMSRSVLYRKLKALTGQSAKEFINTIRLKRAAQLLIQNKLSISEITYMVGYNDPQYFSKCFKKQFGRTPSQYAASAGKEEQES